MPRAEAITDSGMTVPPSMGVATVLNFQPRGNGKAAITGDFVLLRGEVNAVIKALRQNGIAVTALHSHMLMEEPRLFFMHFWANDDALKLARWTPCSSRQHELSKMNAESKVPPTDTAKVPLVQFVGYFLRLGTVGFGGPIALAGHMQQDLVDERGWIRKEDYVEGLALAQLAPGPLAAQLAIYLGYIRAGVLGATAVRVWHLSCHRS